jgi:hypothetical protein
MGTVTWQKSIVSSLLLTLLVTASVSAAPSSELRAPTPPATSEEPTGLQKVGDAFFLRPALAVRLVFGIVMLPIAWPTAALLGDSDWAFEACFHEPLDRLIHRPIGRL